MLKPGVRVAQTYEVSAFRQAVNFHEDELKLDRLWKSGDTVHAFVFPDSLE